MQVGTYPTRNFATLGIAVTSTQRNEWRGDHFCHPPHVAMRIGMSHHSNGARVLGVQSLRVPRPKSRPSLLIVRTGRIVTGSLSLVLNGRIATTGNQRTISVAPDTRVFQHLAEFYNRRSVATHGYSYRRRLPGLRFRASLGRSPTNPSP